MTQNEIIILREAKRRFDDAYERLSVVLMQTLGKDDSKVDKPDEPIHDADYDADSLGATAELKPGDHHRVR